MEIKLNTPLTIEQIDFRVQSINKGGYATILAYKDARADMNRLDEVYGIDGWQKKYEVIDGKLYCSVGVYNKDLSQWIWKQDVGTESMADKEKGQASDAFKRACFNFGIGRELYGYPVMSIKLESNEWKLVGDKVQATWDLRLKEWTWESEFKDGKLFKISCKDNTGKGRWAWEQGKGTINAVLNSPPPVIQEKKPIIMLSFEQFESAMKSTKEGIIATLKTYNGQNGKAMTPEQNDKLTKQLGSAPSKENKKAA